MDARRACEAVEASAASQKATIMPRLERAVGLVERAIDEIHGLHAEASRTSRRVGSCGSGIDSSVMIDAVSVERLLALAHESARGAHFLLRGAGDMRGLAIALPTAISVIRAAASQSHAVAPESSADLGEAAGILGSVALDAALIASTQIRYDLCVCRAAESLEHAKLIVDSKLSKLYPKLDFARLGSIWA